MSVTGDDASKLLAGLVTNGPPADGCCFSALLTPQGKILFDFYITKKPDGYWFDIDAEAAGAFVKRLTLYRLRAKVEITVDDDFRVCIAADSIGSDGRRVTPAAETNTAEINNDYHARRIAAGVPEYGADFSSDEVFLMDVNYDLLNGVDYKKGCFVGQEVASRMKRKGTTRKRTLIATFDGEPPAPATPVTAGESTLGHIMSGAEGAALALIRLDRWENAIKSGDKLFAGEKEIDLKRPAYMPTD